MKFPKAKLVEVLHLTHGILADAARILGCSRSDLADAIEASPALQQAIHDARESMIDAAELALFDLVRKGDTTATAFFLKTQGRKRGWCERWEEELLRQKLEQIERALATRRPEASRNEGPEVPPPENCGPIE